MAQFNFEERIDHIEIEPTNVMTGDRNRSRYLYYQLKMSMAEAEAVDIIVSFLMESGVRMLLKNMKRALNRGVRIRILTGNYLGITQPSALYLIKQELGERVDLRLYNEKSRSFHPKRGISAVAVYSGENGEYAEERNEAIKKLKNGEIHVIFSVDMFNEGVDIASLDMVMFLRPTESPIVFLQQLGRGLRIYKGKQYLNVLDFIGNYEKAGKTPMLLSGERSFANKIADKNIYEYQDFEYPEDCLVDFDMRLIDLFKEMDKKKLTVKIQIQREYFRVKELLDGKRPTRMELFTYMDDDIYQYCVCGGHAKENPFRKYLVFLNEMGELSDDEQKLYTGIGREFIETIETTEMNKVYKMPILYSFYNHGNIRLAVTDEEVLESWKEFFDTGTNWKDFPGIDTYEDYKKLTDKKHLSKAKSMPIKRLKMSGKGFFVEKEGYALALREELGEVVENVVLKEHMKDVLEYRSMEYYRRRYEAV